MRDNLSALARASAILLFLVVAAAYACAAAAPDVNVVKIERWAVFPAHNDGNAFSYFRDGNLTIDFNVFDADLNMEDFNLSAGAANIFRARIYRSTTRNTFQTLIADLNLWELKTETGSGSKWCDDFNFNSAHGGTVNSGDPEDVNIGTTCHYDFNIHSTLVSDGNYYIDINIYDINVYAGNYFEDYNSSDVNFIIDNTAPTAGGGSPDFNMDVNKTGDYNGTNMFYPAGGGGTNYPSTDAFIGWDQNITVRLQESMSKGAGRSHIQSVDFNFWDFNRPAGSLSSTRFKDVNAASAIRVSGGVTWTMVPDINVQIFGYGLGGADENVGSKFVRAVVRDWAGNQTDYNYPVPVLFMGMIYPPDADQNSNTTNLQDINNYERVKLLTFSKSGFGRVRFSADVNLANYSTVVKLRQMADHFKVTRLTTVRNYNDMNLWFDSAYFADLNLACGITLWNLPSYSARPGIKMAGDQNCGTVCSSISWSGTTIDFNVAHFTDFFTDANAPVITNTTPSLGANGIALSLTTDEAATCKYNSSSLPYGSMTSTMSGAGTTSHSADVSPLDLGSYTYYVACTDATDNRSSPTAVSFTITSATGTVQEYCGNGTCGAGENAANCPSDCPPVCGDNACTGTESSESCPEDCLAACGDGVCSGTETCAICSSDCGTCEEVGETVSSTTEAVQPPTASYIDSVLTEAGFTPTEIESAVALAGNFSMVRNVVVSKYASTAGDTYLSEITLEIRNTSESSFANIYMVENVPKSAAQSASLIASGAPFTILKDDPILMFAVSSVAPGAGAVVSYTIAGKLTDAAIADFSAPIVASAVEVAPGEALPGCEEINCNDKNPCTTDLCYSSECFHVPVLDETSCGPAKVCREGVCRPFPAVVPTAKAGTGLDAASTVIVLVTAALVAAALYHMLVRSKSRRRK